MRTPTVAANAMRLALRRPTHRAPDAGAFHETHEPAGALRAPGPTREELASQAWTPPLGGECCAGGALESGEAASRSLVVRAVIARNRATRCRRRRCLRRSLSAAPWIAETYRLKGVKSERRLRALATALPCCFDRDETTYRFRSLTVFL